EAAARPPQARPDARTVIRFDRSGGDARLATTGSREPLEHVPTDSLPGRAEPVGEHAIGDAFALPDEPEQDVLGADVAVPKGLRLAQAELEPPLRPRRERHLARLHLLVAPADDPHDLVASSGEVDLERCEHPGCEPVGLAKEAEEEMLGADVVVLEPTS